LTRYLPKDGQEGGPGWVGAENGYLPARLTVAVSNRDRGEGRKNAPLRSMTSKAENPPKGQTPKLKELWAVRGCSGSIPYDPEPFENEADARRRFAEMVVSSRIGFFQLVKSDDAHANCGGDDGAGVRVWNVRV
jgi:hypothetical protein